MINKLTDSEKLYRIILIAMVVSLLTLHVIQLTEKSSHELNSIESTERTTAPLLKNKTGAQQPATTEVFFPDNGHGTTSHDAQSTSLLVTTVDVLADINLRLATIERQLALGQSNKADEEQSLNAQDEQAVESLLQIAINADPETLASMNLFEQLDKLGPAAHIQFATHLGQQLENHAITGEKLRQIID